MHFFTHLNYLAILTGTVVYFILGAVWYSKLMFSTKWGELNKLEMTEDSKKMMPMMMVISFVMMLIATLGLAILMYLLGIEGIEGGVKLGLLCGLCFSAATMVTNYVYVRKPMALYFIDGGYHVVGFVVASIILSVWH